MARKRVQVRVTEPGLFSNQWQAKAVDAATGHDIDYCYGGDRREAINKIVQKMMARYGSDVEFLGV